MVLTGCDELFALMAYPAILSRRHIGNQFAHA
jgi:hypothetical protein